MSCFVLFSRRSRSILALILVSFLIPLVQSVHCVLRTFVESEFSVDTSGVWAAREGPVFPPESGSGGRKCPVDCCCQSHWYLL